MQQTNSQDESHIVKFFIFLTQLLSFFFSRMQRCKQSGLLPAGPEVQILQPSVLQTDVLQDLSGALTSGAQEKNVAKSDRVKKKNKQKRWREADTALKGREEENGEDWKKKKKQLWTSGKQTKWSAGKRCSEVRSSLFITSDLPALHHGRIQTTAQLITLTQTFLNFHFCEVELGRWFVGDVIFITIIIIDIIVSLSPCLLFYESKVLETSLTEDVPRRRTDGGEDSSSEEEVGVKSGTTVMVLLAGRLLASVHFFVYILYQFTAQLRQRNTITVLYIYCTIPNRAEILSCFCQIVAYCYGRECNVIDFQCLCAGMKILHIVT